MTREELIKFLDENSIAWAPTGSRHICNPPPLDTDEDYVCLMQNGREVELEKIGFCMGTDPAKYEQMPDFLAYRNGEFNVVVTSDFDFYRKFVEATEIARKHNIQDKSQRIAVFQFWLYGRAT